MKYSNDINIRFTGRHKKCISICDKFEIAGKKVLDIGGFNGWFEKYIIERNSSEVIGIDINENLLEQAKKYAEKAKFVKASALDLPFLDEYFDLVVMFDVIEHLPKNSEVLALTEARRVLKKNGTLILSTPNKQFLSNLLDPAWILLGHRHYSVHKITSLLQKAGFSILSIDCKGGLIESISMILLYVFKTFGYEIPFKKWFDKLRDKEYLENNRGFVTLFVVAKKEY